VPISDEGVSASRAGAASAVVDGSERGGHRGRRSRMGAWWQLEQGRGGPTSGRERAASRSWWRSNDRVRRDLVKPSRLGGLQVKKRDERDGERGRGRGRRRRFQRRRGCSWLSWEDGSSCRWIASGYRATNGPDQLTAERQTTLTFLISSIDLMTKPIF
jgi:hypothetical protein